MSKSPLCLLWLCLDMKTAQIDFLVPALRIFDVWSCDWQKHKTFDRCSTSFSYLKVTLGTICPINCSYQPRPGESLLLLPFGPSIACFVHITNWSGPNPNFCPHVTQIWPRSSLFKSDLGHFHSYSSMRYLSDPWQCVRESGGNSCVFFSPHRCTSLSTCWHSVSAVTSCSLLT